MLNKINNLLKKKVSFNIGYANAWIKDKNIRDIKNRLVSLKGTYSGNRCFIMGNGPSLNKMDLSLLSTDYVWGFNRCYLLFDKIQWRPSFYISVDTRVTPDNAEEINDKILSLSETMSFFPKKFQIDGLFKSSPNIYWYHEKKLQYNKLPYGHFSPDASRYVRSVRTVTIAGIQLATYLGFNPIYLIGCDTDYKIPNEVRFEDEKKNNIISLKDSDTNHFSSDYFGKGKKYHQPYPEKMIFSYMQVKKLCDEKGVKVYNATVGGKLEVFPRVDYKQLFKSKISS